MQCLVTGGAGFIGSHLVERLLNDGRDVIVLDNFSTGRPQNLAHLARRPNLRIEAADVAEFSAIRPKFAGIDWVFHLAGLADILPSIETPLAYHRANVDGTINVLESARAAGVKRFVYAASSSCYGIPEEYPTPESARIEPRYPYALTKYLGECYVLHWGQVYDLPVVSLRFFNVYGPRSRTSGAYGAVFGVFLAQKRAGLPFTVIGDGTQTRDFIFVTDVAEACVRAAQSSLVNQVFNVGSGQTCSISRLTELLGGGAVAYVPKRPGEPDCTQADIRRIQSALGWRPAVSLEAGIEVMLDNLDYWENAPVWTAEKIAAASADWFKYLQPAAPEPA